MSVRPRLVDEGGQGKGYMGASPLRRRGWAAGREWAWSLGTEVRARLRVKKARLESSERKPGTRLRDRKARLENSKRKPGARPQLKRLNSRTRRERPGSTARQKGSTRDLDEKGRAQPRDRTAQLENSKRKPELDRSSNGSTRKFGEEGGSWAAGQTAWIWKFGEGDGGWWEDLSVPTWNSENLDRETPRTWTRRFWGRWASGCGAGLRGRAGPDPARRDKCESAGPHARTRGVGAGTDERLLGS